MALNDSRSNPEKNPSINTLVDGQVAAAARKKKGLRDDAGMRRLPRVFSMLQMPRTKLSTRYLGLSAFGRLGWLALDLFQGEHCKADVRDNVLSFARRCKLQYCEFRRERIRHRWVWY